MLIVGEYSIEECDYFGVAIRWYGLRFRVQRIWLGRVIDTGERVVVHIVEAFVIPTNSGIQDSDNRASTIESEVFPNCVDPHIGDCLVHVCLGKSKVLDHHHAIERPDASFVDDGCNWRCARNRVQVSESEGHFNPE